MAINDVLAASKTSQTPASKKNSAQESQDRFLSLLVTQMQNQDPLNPMDNAQLTSQLAQISTVTGIDGLNTTMQSVADQLASLQSMQAVSMAGREVITPGNGIALKAEGNASYGFELPQSVESVQITIADAAGRAVRTLTLGSQVAGTKSFEWDGRSDAGKRAAAGTYTFTVQASAGGQAVQANPMQRAKVESVIREGNAVSLNLGALGTRSLADVRQVM